MKKLLLILLIVPLFLACSSDDDDNTSSKCEYKGLVEEDFALYIEFRSEDVVQLTVPHPYRPNIRYVQKFNYTKETDADGLTKITIPKVYGFGNDFIGVINSTKKEMTYVGEKDLLSIQVDKVIIDVKRGTVFTKQ